MVIYFYDNLSLCMVIITERIIQFFHMRCVMFGINTFLYGIIG